MAETHKKQIKIGPLLATPIEDRGEYEITLEHSGQVVGFAGFNENIDKILKIGATTFNVGVAEGSLTNWMES